MSRGSQPFAGGVVAPLLSFSILAVSGGGPCPAPSEALLMLVGVAIPMPAFVVGALLSRKGVAEGESALGSRLSLILNSLGIVAVVALFVLGAFRAMQR